MLLPTPGCLLATEVEDPVKEWPGLTVTVYPKEPGSKSPIVGLGTSGTPPLWGGKGPGPFCSFVPWPDKPDRETAYALGHPVMTSGWGSKPRAI
ncbi:unnamed protein product [Caretta caretta]